MTVLLVLILSLIIGWLRGGNLKNFGHLHFKYPWLGLAGLWMQAMVINQSFRHFLHIGPYAGVVYSLAYALVFVFFLLNLSIPGFSFVAIGCLLNTLVISLNKGQMPLSRAAAKLTGQMAVYKAASSAAGQGWTTYARMSSHTRLAFLGDVIPLPKPFPLPVVISLGDIFILAGIFWLVQKVMLESSLVARRS